MPNVVDLLILLLCAAAIARGVFFGAARQALTLCGLLVGFTVGAALAPRLARLVNDPVTKAAFALVVLSSAAVLGQTLARLVGVRIWGQLRRRGFGRTDSVVGGALGGLVSLLVAWLVAGPLATAPMRDVAVQVQGSLLVRGLNETLPPTPPLFSRLHRLLEARGLPQVFAGLEPHSRVLLPPATEPEVQAAVDRARAATVQVQGRGCGGRSEGSGFVAGPDLVVTNAHVVAGIAQPVVIDEVGPQPASPVIFDPELDVAVLRVARPPAAPLVLLETRAERGTTAAVLGFPEGGPFSAEPAVILDHYDAVGRDIYSGKVIPRSVYELRANVQPGNSGGPLVRADGTVVGVIFSRAVLQDGIGYALASDEVAKRVAAARRSGASIRTGPCAA